MAAERETIDMVITQGEDIACGGSTTVYGTKFAIGNSNAFSGIFYIEGKAPKVDVGYQISLERKPTDEEGWADVDVEDILLENFEEEDPTPVAIIPILAVWMRLKIVPKLGNESNSVLHSKLGKRKI